MTMRLPIRLFTVIALAIAVGLASGLSPYASSTPDGLEKVAGDHAFLDRSRPARIQQAAPVRDYAVPGISDPRLATGLAGFAGTLGVFALGCGIAAAARRRRPAPAPAVPS